METIKQNRITKSKKDEQEIEKVSQIIEKNLIRYFKLLNKDKFDKIKAITNFQDVNEFYEISYKIKPLIHPPLTLAYDKTNKGEIILDINRPFIKKIEGRTRIKLKEKHPFLDVVRKE